MRHDSDPDLAWLLAAALTATLGACGQWVDYDPNSTTLPGTPAPTADAGLGEVKASRLRHDGLAAALRPHLSRSGDNVLLDYVGVAADAEARASLSSYLTLVAAVDPAALADGDERAAFWINAYNAAVIQTVILRFEGDVGYRPVETTFFADRIHNVGGVLLSLDQLEHGVLRGDAEHESVKGLGGDERSALEALHGEVWSAGKLDARVHAALNCAALSCPNLLDAEPFVFRGESLDSQLEAAVGSWLADEAKGAGPDGVSKLFEWFKKDFEAAAGSVEGFIAKHRVGGGGGVDASKYLEYDWTLNAVR